MEELDDKVVAVARGVAIKAKTGNRAGLEADLVELERLKKAGASCELVDPLVGMVKAYLSKASCRNAAAAGGRRKTRRSKKGKSTRKVRPGRRY